ncbi:MAG: hypothetical protein WCC06_11430 [Candidatus Aminicenantales bacterium]
MKKKILKTGAVWLCLFLCVLLARADRRSDIYSLALELEKLAGDLAQESFDHFKGWNGTISDEEQAVLFKSEAFAAACRLFLKFTEARSDYFRQDFLRTNLYNAFTYLAGSFRDLEKEMRRGGVMPYILSNCRKILNRMESEFSRWPAADNLAYLHQKYVKVRNATVYMIERKGIGRYIRHAFKNLESIYRFNFDLKRGKDPWTYLIEVSDETLEKIPEGKMIDLTFEGCMIIEQGNRPNRPVYLIRNGKKHGLTRPAVVMRFGGWGKVYEVPQEVIHSYAEGEPID